MTRLAVWPPEPAAPFSGLASDVAESLGLGAPVAFDPRAVSGDTLVLVICEPGQDPTPVLTAIADGDVTAVAVVSDAYLGTDTTDLGAALAGSTAVTTVRSIAARMGGSARANAVCVPDTLWNSDTAQRGPLATATEIADVVEAVSFLFGDDASYLTGQVLFLTGGRHIFSSMSA